MIVCRKAILAECWQVVATNDAEPPQFVREALASGIVWQNDNKEWYYRSCKGAPISINVGDYLMRDDRNGLFICRQDVFDADYFPLELDINGRLITKK
jgi:hypothetical protein